MGVPPRFGFFATVSANIPDTTILPIVRGKRFLPVFRSGRKVIIPMTSRYPFRGGRHPGSFIPGGFP